MPRCLFTEVLLTLTGSMPRTHHPDRWEVLPIAVALVAAALAIVVCFSGLVVMMVVNLLLVCAGLGGASQWRRLVMVSLVAGDHPGAWQQECFVAESTAFVHRSV